MSNMSTFVSFLLLAITAFSSSASSAKTPCNTQDRDALIAIKNAFPDALSTWAPPGVDCCFWGHVECAKGRVTSLKFKNMNLTGSLPLAIGDLTSLQLIFFRFNPNLVGPLPSSFSKLTSLQSLTVYVSGLSGAFPSYLSTFTQLQVLNFIHCKFVGTIPPSLANLAQLWNIDLSGNQLTGSIPDNLFSKLTTNEATGPMATLGLAYNKLSGEIPRSLGNIQLQSIILNNNNLTGDASFLFGITNPNQQIILANNSVSFDLTNVEYGSSLQFVDLSHNQIYGSISSQINNATYLSSYDVSYNNLCGEIPSGKLGESQFNASFFEHNKCLCGTPLPSCTN